MARNTKGQWASTNSIEIALKKRLLAIAKDDGIKLKAMVRDKLEEELRFNVYTSYRPATKKGKDTQYYNETHKHQKARPYHHTGLLASKIDAIIDGDSVKAIVRDAQYADGASTTEVYDYLKFGTTNTPKKSDVYDYNNGNNFSQYISQKPHNFEARTRDAMESYLNELKTDIEQNGKKYINPKYLKKLRKSDM